MSRHRDVNPLLRIIREFLLGRVHLPALRFEDTISERTQPQPQLPMGNPGRHYYKRDPRGLIKAPLDISEKKDKSEERSSKKKPPLPGKVHIYD